MSGNHVILFIFLYDVHKIKFGNLLYFVFQISIKLRTQVELHPTPQIILFMLLMHLWRELHSIIPALMRSDDARIIIIVTNLKIIKTYTYRCACFLQSSIQSLAIIIIFYFHLHTIQALYELCAFFFFEQNRTCTY